MNAATRAVLDYLRTQADVIATRADDVLIDAPDAVHRSRVATRRTRSALRTFTPLFKKTRTRALRDELVWHADRLGAPRDAEVLKERLLATLDALPSDHVVGPVRARLADELDLAHAAAHAQLVVSIIGGLTALIAALIGLTQNDLKRVLAYSTVSQLGYMFLGLGTGTFLGIGGAMFHLVTHAFFKALLFLGAGSVMHAMGGVIDMRHFGGLRKLMPKTYVTFLIGAFALAGLFPLSGFWSKDTILASVRMAAHPEAHAADSHAPAASGHDAHGKEAHGQHSDHG